MAKNNETERVKVKLDEGKTVCLYESDRDVSMDEISDYCEANEMEVPEENSREYWDIANYIREGDWEDFRSNLKYSRKLPGMCVITGELGLWDGNHEIRPVIASMAEDPEKFFGKFALNSSFEIEIGYDGEGFFVSVRHHDGTNSFRILEITEDGQRYLDRCDDQCVEPDILSEDRFTRKIDYWIF